MTVFRCSFALSLCAAEPSFEIEWTCFLALLRKRENGLMTSILVWTRLKSATLGHNEPRPIGIECVCVAVTLRHPTTPNYIHPHPLRLAGRATIFFFLRFFFKSWVYCREELNWKNILWNRISHCSWWLYEHYDIDCWNLAYDYIRNDRKLSGNTIALTHAIIFLSLISRIDKTRMLSSCFVKINELPSMFFLTQYFRFLFN